MRTIAISNQKGGVGKTTTAHHLATALAATGARVLAVDLDPQGHLSLATGCGSRTCASLYEVLSGTSALSATLVASPHGFTVAPADQLLARIDGEGMSRHRWYARLTDALSTVDNNFDWCIVDTPPSLGVLSINALVAAQSGGVLVPVQPELLSLSGFRLLSQTIAELAPMAPHLQLLGVVPTMVNARWASHRDVLHSLSAQCDTRILAAIPRHGSFVQATLQRSTIFTLAPKSKAAAAYRALADTFGLAAAA